MVKLPGDLLWFLKLCSTGFFSDVSRLFQLLWEVARFFVSNDLCLKRYILYCILVGGFNPLWKIWKSMGRMTSHILYGKKCLKPPTRYPFNSNLPTYRAARLDDLEGASPHFRFGWAATVGMLQPGFTQKQWVKVLKSHWGKNHVITMSCICLGQIWRF